MPVTAKLSKAFYDRFGDDIVTELVELLNQVNEAYRADLAQVIEANNLRIDGKFGQLRAEVRADLSESAGAVRKEIGDGISALRKELVDSNASLRKDMTEGFAAMRVQIAGVRADLMKWSFAFWVGAVLAIAALAGVLRWTS
jgi:hypothetical protein